MNIELNEPYGFIYITTNMVNGKRYIGQKKFQGGYNAKAWLSYLGSGIKLKKAIKKYGQDNFYRDIVSIAYSKDELDNLEIEWIKNYNAVNSDDFYNIAEGGHNASPYTGKTKEELKQYRINRSLGRKKAYENMTQEELDNWKLKLKENNPKYWLGRNHTTESKIKIGLASKGRNSFLNKTKEEKQQWGNNISKGLKNISKEKRDKLNKELRESRLGKDNPNARQIICLTTNKKFDTVKQAYTYYKLSHHMSEYIDDQNGYYGTLKNGTRLIWMYYDKYLNSNNEEIQTFINNSNKKYIRKNIQNKKAVICLTTNEVYKSIKDASVKYFNKDKSHIGNCCNEKRNYCGELSDGTKLQWKYIKDLTLEEYIKYDIENKLKELHNQELGQVC